MDKRKTADHKRPVLHKLSNGKGRQFFLLHQQTNEVFYRKMEIMVQKIAEKITRERLREMQDGEQITVQCSDGYDLDSQKNTAYAMQKMENCRFACKSDGLTLTVTRYDTD